MTSDDILRLMNFILSFYYRAQIECFLINVKVTSLVQENLVFHLLVAPHVHDQLLTWGFELSGVFTVGFFLVGVDENGFAEGALADGAVDDELVDSRS